MEKGKKVEVFEDPKEKTKKEGDATIIQQLYPTSLGEVSRCLVQFDGDSARLRVWRWVEEAA